MTFPITRMRRMRSNPVLRSMVRETHLAPEHMIYPMFVRYGEGERRPISSMPGQFQLSIDELVKEARVAYDVGIRSLILFGIPNEKDEMGSEAYADDGIICRAIRALKEATPDLLVIADVCLCEYTSHGHCGVVHKAGEEFQVVNDLTLDLLAKTALASAKAGADVIAPSDMMDGRIGHIRIALDQDGYQDIPIFSYAAKFSSSYYGPFRDAAEGAPQFGDRSTYQMDICNGREAIREVALDIEEGADLVIVKPALPYLDIISQVRQNFPSIPIGAYNVSGEFAMIKAAAANGWLNEEKVVLETLKSIRRAGSDVILTYHAVDAARWLQG